jgi:site-specific DNA-cytosine methylase
MVQAGYDLIAKCELTGGFGVPNCEANRHLLGRGWRAHVGPEDSWPVVPADVVFGNPPCSAWSVMTSKTSKGRDAKVSHCMWAFVEYAAKVMPQVAVFESVQQAYTNPLGLAMMRDLRRHLEELTGERWDLHHVLHNAYSVGGPAMRRRYFWIASRVPFGIAQPQLEYLPSWQDVIGDLAPLGESWQAQPYRAPAHPWTRQLLRSDELVDGHISIDNPLTQRVKDLACAVEWCEGEDIAKVARRHYDAHGKLPLSFAETEDRIVSRDFMMGYTTPVRWRADAPTRVITGGSLIMVLHPWLNRTITHREAARALGFPDDWRIAPLRNSPGLMMTWGKGITTHCGKWIGWQIANALDGQLGPVTGQPLGERETVIDITNDWQRFSRAAR